MKILIIRNFPSYMSVKNNTYNIQEVGLAKALSRKGHICDILFWTNRNEETVTIPVDNGGVVHVFYRHGKSILKNTVFTHCNDLFEQYDVLQPCEYNQIQSWLLAKKYSKKVVIYHGPYYSAFNKRYNLMCRFFDMFFLRRYIKQQTPFLVKSNLAQKFLTDKGINESNVCTVGVGIDTQMLVSYNGTCDDYIYHRMIHDHDAIKILYIGRFEERRNIKFLIDVFKKTQQLNNKVILYMVGTGEKSYLESCFSYIKELELEDKVVWQEKIEQKYLSQIYQMADFFLLPTEYEIFGMVLLEAMYYKTIVLTTYNGGSSTLIKNDLNGCILPTNSTDEWAKKICAICKDGAKMRAMQNNASSVVSKYYTWDSLANRFLEQYARLQERK